MMETIIRQDSDLWTKYEQRRGDYLEEETARLFANAFPFAPVFRGSQWHDPITSKDYENGLLVVVDSYLIIVESKAGRVTAPARRGADARLQYTVDKLVQDPSEQSARFAEFLLQHPGQHRFSTKHGTTNNIDTSAVQVVIRLNTTLDHLGILAARVSDLQAADFVAQDVEPVPTILATDLALVFR